MMRKRRRRGSDDYAVQSTGPIFPAACAWFPRMALMALFVPFRAPTQDFHMLWYSACLGQDVPRQPLTFTLIPENLDPIFCYSAADGGEPQCGLGQPRSKLSTTLRLVRRRDV